MNKIIRNGIKLTLALIIFVSFPYTTWYLYTHSIRGLSMGGSVHITEPKGSVHIHTQWKSQSVWHEYYTPADNTCVLQEVSGYGVVEGSIIVDNCNYPTVK